MYVQTNKQTGVTESLVRVGFAQLINRSGGMASCVRGGRERDTLTESVVV